MRRPCGMTLAEILISSAIMLLIVGLASGSVVSYLKAYGQFTETSSRSRVAAHTLEALVQHLRSAEVVYSPDRSTLLLGTSLATPLVFVERGTERDRVKSLRYQNGQILLLDAKDKTEFSLGKVDGVRLQLGQGRDAMLQVQIDSGNAPLLTALCWRGIVP